MRRGSQIGLKLSMLDAGQIFGFNRAFTQSRQISTNGHCQMGNPDLYQLPKISVADEV